MLLALAFFYSASTLGVYQGAGTRAEALSDEISYSLEILSGLDESFPVQRLIEKASTLEDVVQIIVIDTQNKIVAHTNKIMVGQSFNSLLVSESILQNKKVSKSIESHVIFISPLHGQFYTREFQDVNRVLWVEIDISPSVSQVQKDFGSIALMAFAVLFIFYIAQYFIVKTVIIDRLHAVETGMTKYINDGISSSLMIEKSFGSEDEINTLAQAYNYLMSSLGDSQKKIISERDFATHIMESMGEGLTISNAMGFFEYANPAYAALIGYSSKELVGQMPKDVTPPEYYDTLSKEWELCKSGKSSSYETQLLTKDRTEIHVLISSVPSFQNGIFSGSISVITNISERVLLEQMKTDFINRASHQIRTPLTTAILMTTLLEGGGTAEEQQQFLAILKQELNRERLLINDLLIASRIEEEMFEVHLSPTNLISIIEEAVSSVRPLADARQITIQLEGTESSLPLAFTDSQALFQVVLNLLSNAIKFSHPHDHIEVVACKMENTLTIAVKDHGIGIPAQDLPHITSRFFRAQNATQMEIPGTGIGLHIIKEILKSLEGHMEINSTENQGTTITISIPVQVHMGVNKTLE